jgi:hypothetical protein
MRFVRLNNENGSYNLNDSVNNVYSLRNRVKQLDAIARAYFEDDARLFGNMVDSYHDSIPLDYQITRDKTLGEIAEHFDFVQVSSGHFIHSDYVCRCDHCDAQEHEGNLTEVYVRDNNSEQWCESCKNNQTFYCEGSDCHYYVRFHRSVCVDGYTYHVDHAPEDYSDDKDVSDYHAGARRYFPQESERCYGVELEIYFPSIDNRRAFCAEFFPSFPEWRAERDGSLTSSSAEIISPPLPMAEYRDGGLWPKLCALARAHGAQGWRHRASHGIHVNVDLRELGSPAGEYLDDDVVARFVAAINNLPDLSRRVAGRDRFYSADYQKTDKTTAKYIVGSSEKYAAVRVRSRACAEVRIFGANLNPSGILRTVEYCDAMLEFSRAESTESVVYWPKAETECYSAFKEFCANRGYATLAEYL